MKDVQCYELFGGIALKNHAFSFSELSSVEKANQFCEFLRTALGQHAPPSLRKVINHNSSPWLESIRDELLMAKRGRREAERKCRNTKLTIFKDLYRQAKHKVQTLAHTAKCQFYTERIAMASSLKELHQIVNTLSIDIHKKHCQSITLVLNFQVFSSDTLQTK